MRFCAPHRVTHQVVLLSLLLLCFAADRAIAVERKNAIVVGGGPVGLATALTLSNEPHCFDVTVLEQSQTTSRYDPTKAYVYGITSRGQAWMEQFSFKVVQKLRDYGTAFRPMTDMALISSDPTKPLPQPRSVEGKVFGKVETGGTQNYWIPRHSLIQLFLDMIGEQEKARKQTVRKRQLTSIGSITLFSGQQCVSLRCKAGMVEVLVKDAKETAKPKIQTFPAHLVVGADGFNSAVRQHLAGLKTENDDVTDPTASWLTSKPDKFKVKKWISPSTGLRMKVLQFPKNFPLTDIDGTVVETDPERLYMIVSVHNGPTNRLRLGMLPIKNPQGGVRTANSITRPNHDIWQLKDGNAAKEWYQKAFPRLNFDDLVDDAEWDRFAEAEGTTFPPCQYCPGLQVSSPDETSGVVLVGDALHAFPPDLGQGINSGLSDVMALDRALRGENIISGKESSKKAPPTLGAALREYERVRGPEVDCLCDCKSPHSFGTVWSTVSIQAISEKGSHQSLFVDHKRCSSFAFEQN